MIPPELIRAFLQRGQLRSWQDGFKNNDYTFFMFHFGSPLSALSKYGFYIIPHFSVQFFNFLEEVNGKNTA